MASGSCAASSATCGVTPQAQKSGSRWRGRQPDRQIGLVQIGNPDQRRITQMNGGAMNRRVSSRSESQDGLAGWPHAHDHFCLNGPAGWHSMLVRYIGTLTPSVTFLISIPALLRASKENEQPKAKPPNHPATGRGCHRTVLHWPFSHPVSASQFEYRCLLRVGRSAAPGWRLSPTADRAWG